MGVTNVSSRVNNYSLPEKLPHEIFAYGRHWGNTKGVTKVSSPLKLSPREKLSPVKFILAPLLLVSHTFLPRGETFTCGIYIRAPQLLLLCVRS